MISPAQSLKLATMILIAIATVPDDDSGAPWFMIGLAAQCAVTICFLAQLIAFLRTGKIVIPPVAIGIGLTATIFTIGYAVYSHQWILLLAEATSFAAGLQVLAWHRRTAGLTSAQRRPGLPVVAPHSADPKSGVFPIPHRQGEKSSAK